MRAHEKITGDPLPEVIDDYVERNRLAWDRWAPDYVSAGRKAWAQDDLTWGIWDLPESELNVIESVAPGSDVVELGCGTAGVSALLARRGLRPVAIDVSRAQLATAERLQVEIGPSFPLIQANAEDVPFDTESFDLAISEYGASLWCEARRWLPEAYRLLRRGGLLLMITNSPLLMACTGDDGATPTDRLVRDYFTSHRLEFPGDGTVEFHLVHGEWIELLRASGFSLERLIEVRSPHGGRPRLPFVSVDWARLWPSEDIWIARKV
jgi:SAM-dependent methyltransferase